MSKATATQPFKQLIEDGRVCQPKFYVTADEFHDLHIGSPIDQYRKQCDGKKAIVFCITVEHAEHTCALFENAGIHAATLLSSQNQAERTANIERFRSGDLKVLVNVAMLLTGIRWPEVDAVIIANPTRSRTKFMQQVSIGLTPRFPEGQRTLTSDQRRDAIAASDKPHATIIDLAGNVLRLGLEDF